MACATLCAQDNEGRMLSKKELTIARKSVRKVVADTARCLQQRHHIKHFGDGAAMFGGILRELGISFQIVGPLTKEQLRSILVDCATELLCTINANENLRPYLIHYPFTIDQVTIKLFVVDERGYGIEPPKIAIAKAMKGKLTYVTLGSEIGSYKIVGEEPLDAPSE
jgi:hypothetical protein